MSKRLIVVLALALVAGLTMAAYAEVQNVKVSGDITALGISRNLDLRGRSNNATENAMASIARVRIDADLTDNVMTTVRLLNERYWGNEIDNAGTETNNTDISLDLAYVTLKEFLYSPLTLTVGRQELHFGNDMIVGDYDTNNVAAANSAFGANKADHDLSARKAFDAIRATLDYKPLVVDLVAAKVRENNLYTKDDVDLYGINAGYAFDKKNTKVEGYWFEKRTGRQTTAGLAAGKKVDRVDTIGGRISTEPIDNLIYQLEAAYQFGKYVGTASSAPTADRKAWALETALTYNMPKVKYTPSVTALYSYFSGDHENGSYSTGKGAYRGWDPMFENQKTGDIANALFNQTNAHILGGIASMKPMNDLTLKGEYYAYWWAKAYQDGVNIPTARDTTETLTMREKRFAGQEVDLTATYDYTEDVQFSLMGGVLVPGSAFDKVNDTPATEVIGSMKVTF